MKIISIFIDSCAWNILFEHKINLAIEFGGMEFDFAMTKEVASFEIDAIPFSKVDLKEYVKKQIESANVREDSYFGFSDCNDPEDYKSRVSGFNEGRFISYEEGEQLNKFERIKEKLMKTGLYKDEADSSLAVRATTGGIVLTAENPTKNGPLKDALLEGGAIIYIQSFDPKIASFRDFIIEKLDSLLNKK